MRSAVPVPDGSGIAPAGRPGEFIATSGQGGAFQIDARPGAARPIRSGFLAAGRWDNHLAVGRLALSAGWLVPDARI